MSDSTLASMHLVDRSRVFIDTNTRKWLVLHKTGGTPDLLALSNWFATGAPMVSTHYGVGQDGDIWQFVLEQDGAGGNCCLETGHADFLPTNVNLNWLTISIEHIDPSSDNSTPLTSAQKHASFALIKDICSRNAIPGSGSHDGEAPARQGGTLTPLLPATKESVPTATARPTPTETPVPGHEPGPCDTPPGVTPVSAAEIDSGNMRKPQVAFTFDAGGEVAPALQILGILNKRAVHATWFFTGTWAEQNPDIVRHVADAGYVIGNHTATHPDLTTLTDTQVCNELTQAEKIISGIAGRTTRPYFRPPFGARNQRVRRLAANLGYRTVYWTIDTLDWQPQSTPDSILQRIQSQLTSGAIILMHAGSSSEAQALDRVITMVQQKGYQLVTLPEIVQGTGSLENSSAC